MKPLRAPIPFLLPALFLLPTLLLLPSCGGESADDPEAQASVASSEAPAEPEIFSDVPEAQAAYNESLELWGTDGWASLAKLKEAIELDPDFTEAHALLGMRYAYVHQTYDRSDSIADQALGFAETALEMEPENAMAINAMGNYFYRVEKDYPKAVEYFSRGAALYPDQTVFVRMQAHAARRAGDWDQALALLQRSEEMEPSLDAIQAIAENHLYNRRWDQAEAAYQEHARRAPEGTMGPSNLAWIEFDRTGETGAVREFLASRPTGWAGDRWNLEMLDRDYEAALAAMGYFEGDILRGQYGIHPKAYYQGVALRWMGDEAGATAAFQDARGIMEGMLPALDDDCRVHAGLGDVYAALGMRDEAVAAATRATEVMPVEKDALTGTHNHLALARVYSVLGEPGPAVEQIRYLMSVPSGLNMWDLRKAPVWDPIRDDPAFQALLEQ